MKKTLTYLAVTAGLSAILGITSRLSVGFSEWYAANVYPVFVAVLGRLFGLLPFSAAEILLILLFPAALFGLVFIIIKTVRGKGRRRQILGKAGLFVSCFAMSVLLSYILFCGINYNRRPFIDGMNLPMEKIAAGSDSDRWIAYLTLLDEFYTAFPDSGVSTVPRDENGVFKLTDSQRKSAPAAMRKLAEKYPRLDVYYPPPKPVLLSELMSDAYLLGIFSPFTMEANVNNIAPDSEKATSSIHELAHVAGFMKEDEANFISFLAARESGNPELMYAAYLYAFGNFYSGWITEEIYNELPGKYKDLFDKFADKLGGEWIDTEFDESEENGEAAEKTRMFDGDWCPETISNDLSAQIEFWNDRYYDTTYVYDDAGEVVDVIVDVNPIVEAISEVSSEVNDTYLKIQGQEDGVLTYWGVSDLLFVFYLMQE